jgi:hypothetical protein
MRIGNIVFLFMVFISCSDIQTIEKASGNVFFEIPEEKSHQTRWSSFENPSASKGSGGLENKGGKGHAFERLKAGETKTLLDIEGMGIVRRMWITIMQKDPRTLRSLRLEMFWDHADTPAVSVPFGDFFGSILGRNHAFENAFFANPEGRSYNCYIPMPFKKHARITVTNEADYPVSHIFYDVNVSLEPVSKNALYFHAWWLHQNPNPLGEDFEILPRIKGQGKYLGAHLGVVDHPQYRKHWWGEGEVKIYLDRDKEAATLVGTGTEDYIGTGWGQGSYFHNYQGCSIADWPLYGMYRYHIPDPVYFYEDIRVALQQIGGNSNHDQISQMKQAGVPLIPVSIDARDDSGFLEFIKLLDMDPVPEIDDPSLPNGHMNYYRETDICAVAFFYLDRPVNGLPPIESVEDRISGLPTDSE